MRKTIIIIICIMISGCGSEYGATDSKTAGASSGIYVDKAYFDVLEREFQETVTCTGLEGNFWDVKVFLLPPPRFNCTGDNLKGKLCYGEFVTPNKILLADIMSWRHEAIHYLLYRNSEDLDPDHESPLFDQCA